MELNVCGAIPPYNEILGGKLVALLATSPQVIHDYKERYSNKASMIASRLKGQDVFRPADLVYVGTTSLYYVGSSQYNRLRIPGSVFGSDFDVVWKKLGMTIGFGTMHISKATTLSLTEATSDGFSRINHVFGEGASPKMRLLTMSIRELLESTNEDSKDFSKHAMSRIVYGVCLATNTLDYLMGKDTSPKYYTDVNHYQEGTQKIIDYWTTRWLSSRLNFAPIYERIRGFDKGSFMVGNQIKDSEPRPFVKLKEVSHMPVNDEKKVGLQFIRDFYRGSSAYADHVDEELLSYIHLTTKLDAAIIKAVEDGNNYQPVASIPIGEMQYDKRMVNVWAADNSRIISQYLTLLRGYNLYPKAETLIEILRQFGHVASNGLISIPKFGSDAQAVDNKKKGLIGTLFAASWYMKQHDDALVASLDDDKARLWLQNSKYGNERADLVGLYYDEASNTLHIEPIEVKTRDESPDATITRDESDSKSFLITGHAAGQIASMIEILREIFTADDNQMDMFTSARREVLKYQIVSECFRNVHDSDWQKKWYLILKRAFSSESEGGVNIVVSGLLLHIKLNEAVGGDHISCTNPDFDNCRIDYWKLTAKEIQCDILGEGTLIKETVTPDFDESEDSTLEENGVEDAIIDIDMDAPAEPSITSQQENSTVYTSPTITPSDLPKVAEKTIPYRQNEEPSDTVSPVAPENSNNDVSRNEIEQLVKDFKRSCGDYHVSLKECNSEDTVVGPSVIRLKFRLGRGQSLQGLSSHLEDIGREMKRTGVIIQQVPNSDELLLDVPRLKREKVLFKNVIASLPHVTSPEQLYFPLGRTPNGEDLIEDLGQMPHMLVGGSTGSGKSVFLFTMLAAMLMTHPSQDELKLVLSSSKLEDFIHFEGLPHLYSGGVISDAIEATRVIKDVIFEESERRGKLLAEARVANITEYNRIASKKLAPIVVVIDEFADLADQLETKKEQNAFYKPVQRIAQAGRSRGIHLVICTQRPEAKLVPSTTKAQLNGRVALRVNDGISSRMIIETPDAQYLQKHGDMIYKNGDIVERAQGYLIEIPELDEIVKAVINRKQ